MLCIPAIAWNLAFGGLLPENYADLWFDTAVSWYILIPEIIFRLSILVLSVMMPLYIFTRIQRTGLILYVVGTFLYFLSWRPLILYPAGDWSSSFFGFTAPVFAQIILLTGIAMIGYRWYANYRFSRWYFFAAAMLYSIFRFLHILEVFRQNHDPFAS